MGFEARTPHARGSRTQSHAVGCNTASAIGGRYSTSRATESTGRRVGAISSASGVPARHAGGTWHDVFKKCLTLGARLCTFNELKRGCASGTGGGYDLKPVWSSTPCGDDGGGGGQSYYAFQWAQEGSSPKVNSVPAGTKCERSDSTDVYTRCCADPPACAANGPHATWPGTS